MLHFQIEFSSGLSVYRQLTEQIRFYIASETLKAEDKLPSVRALAKELSINPATVVKAYNILQNEGLIELRQGRGAFVLQVEHKTTEVTEEQKLELEMKAQRIATLAQQMNLNEVELTEIILKHYREMKDEHSN